MTQVKSIRLWFDLWLNSLTRRLQVWYGVSRPPRLGCFFIYKYSTKVCGAKCAALHTFGRKGMLFRGGGVKWQRQKFVAFDRFYDVTADPLSGAHGVGNASVARGETCEAFLRCCCTCCCSSLIDSFFGEWNWIDLMTNQLTMDKNAVESSRFSVKTSRFMNFNPELRAFQACVCMCFPFYE